MVCTKIVAWKGIHGARPMLHRSYDATNAFACGLKSQVGEGIRDRFEEDGDAEEADLNLTTLVTLTRREDHCDHRCSRREDGQPQRQRGLHGRHFGA